MANTTELTKEEAWRAGADLPEQMPSSERQKVLDQRANAKYTDETEAPSAFTNTLATAYHKASTTYNHLMEPIHQINEYVDKKNELDEKYANDPESEDYKKAVEDLQSDYFGDDVNRIALANKFEAVQDWQDAHGITEIKESIASAGTKLKEMFAETSFGQKYEEIKQLAKNMDTPETDTKTAESETEKSEEMASASEETKTDTEKTSGAAESMVKGGIDRSMAGLQAEFSDLDLGGLTASAEMNGPECS